MYDFVSHVPFLNGIPTYCPARTGAKARATGDLRDARVLIPTWPASGTGRNEIDFEPFKICVGPQKPRKNRVLILFSKFLPKMLFKYSDGSKYLVLLVRIKLPPAHGKV